MIQGFETAPVFIKLTRASGVSFYLNTAFIVLVEDDARNDDDAATYIELSTNGVEGTHTHLYVREPASDIMRKIKSSMKERLT